MKNNKGMKFSKSLVKHFHNLVEVPTSMQKRISMLEEMEDFFGEDMFSYDNDDSRVLAMKYLLGTWEILIHDVKSVRTRDQYVIYRIITKVSIRKEFYLETCGFNSEQYTVSPIFLPLLQRYSTLLATTFLYCQQVLHETTSSIPVLFCSKIFILCYYRLPSIHCLFNHCFFNLYPSSQLTDRDVQKSFSLTTDSSGLPILKSHSVLQLSSLAPNQSSPPEFHSVHEADNLSVRSVVTVDFSEDVIVNSSAPSTPSPQPLHNEFSPSLEFSPELEDTFSGDLVMEGNSCEIKDNSILPGLRVKNYIKSIDARIFLKKDHQQQNLQNLLKLTFPSLFYWMKVVQLDIVEGVEEDSWWLQRLTICDSFLFDLIRCRFDLLDDYQSYLNTHFRYEDFPCYFLFLRCFLPSFQHAVLQKYNCGIQRRSEVVNASDYIAAGVKTSCYFLKDPIVVNMLFEMIMSECNIYISSDINTFFLYLDTWCNTLLREKDDKKDDVDDARGTIIEGIQHYIILHPHDGDEFLCRYLVSNRFCCDVSEANNAIAVLKHDDILKVTNNGLRIDNLYNSFSKMETPIHCFHLSFPYFTLYSSLYTILEQDHLLILKYGLMFIYYHASFFIGNYRYYFYTHIFNQFSRLFSHWDGNVRLLFHHILLYTCLVSLQRDIPHFSSDQLLSLIDEQQLEKAIAIQSKTSKTLHDACSSFLTLYKKWKKKQTKEKQDSFRFTNDQHVHSILLDSIDNETTSIDIVLASKIDSYLIIAITELNNPEKYKVPRNHYSDLLSSVIEYIQLLVVYENKEKKVKSRKDLTIPTFDSAAILRDPNQK